MIFYFEEERESKVFRLFANLFFSRAIIVLLYFKKIEKVRIKRHFTDKAEKVRKEVATDRERV